MGLKDLLLRHYYQTVLPSKFLRKTAYLQCCYLAGSCPGPINFERVLALGLHNKFMKLRAQGLAYVKVLVEAYSHEQTFRKARWAPRA